MKQNICVLSLFAFAWAGFSQGTFQTVVPNGLANVEGNSSSSDLFTTASTRFQQVYSSTEFNSLGGSTGRIDGISFRLDGGSGQRAFGLWSISVYLSTTSRSPDSLSPVFDDNHGSDVISVYGGPLGIIATNSSLTPRPFEVRIPFSTRFLYNPSIGNLAVDIVAFGPTNLVLDAELSAGDSIGRVFGANALNGTVDSLGLISRFDITTVPEPSPWALFILGLAVIGIFARPRSRTKPQLQADCQNNFRMR